MTLNFRQNLRYILFQLFDEMNRDGILKEDRTIGDVNRCIENLMKKEGFIHFAHYELCDCQRQNLPKTKEENHE